MNRYYRFTWRVFVLFAFFASIVAPSLAAGRHPVKKTENVQTVNHYKPMDINNVFNYYGNNGDGSFNRYSSTNEGFEFPIGSNAGTTIFEDGLVWTAFKNGTLHCGGSTYWHGLQPGKILTNGTTSSLPVADDPNKPEYRVYRVRPDIQPTTDAAKIALETSLLQNEVKYTSRFESVSASDLLQQYWDDWNNWPASDGAPFTDASGVAHYNGGSGYDPATCVPGFPGADQTEWMVMNDLDSTLTHGLYGSDPIGIEVQRTIWAYNTAGALGNTIFISYKFINKSGVQLNSMYVSQWSDPDLGYAGDDAVGCDTMRSLGYVYNGISSDSWYASIGFPPPAIGFDFFQGPVVPGTSSDTAIFDMRKNPGKKNLPMTSFSFFINGNTTFSDPPNNIDGTRQWYNLMQGLISLNGSLFPLPVTGGSKYAYPGDPVTNTGPTYIGTAAVASPGDVRMCMNSGPFTMAPGDTQQVVVAALAGLGTDYLSSITALRSYDDIAQFAYNHFFTYPKVSYTASFSQNQISLSVKADAQKINASDISIELRKYDGMLVTSSSLTNNGSGMFSGTLQFAPQAEGLYANAVVKYQTGETLTWSHIIENITTTSLSISSFGVASDNLNDDGIVNPGENIRYVFSLKNNSAINFSNLTVRANPNYDGHWLTIPTFNAGATQSFSYSAVDPSTYLSFTVPKYYTDSTINVFLRITDESNNLWLDTLTFDVKPFSHQLYFSPVARLSGISTMTLSISIVDSSQVKNHLYVVTGVDSLPLTGKPGYTLKDSTTNTILLANHPLPDQLGHISPIVDGFKVLLANYDTLKGMANWSMSGVRHWTWANGNFGMEGFGGAIGNGYDNYFSGSTVGYDKLRDVEVRFATTDTAGNILNSNDANASFAYRYLRKANSPPAQPSFSSFIIKTGVGYVFQDYNKSMPIAVYDINTNPPRRLMIGYLENNVINGLVDGKYWPPYYADPVYGDNLGTSGPREWFFIFDKNYSTTPDATLETDILDNTLPIMWFGTVTRRDQNGWSSADTFRIIAHHPITSNDKWTFTPSVMVLTGVKQQPIPSSFSLSQNYPNPFNPSTTIRYELPAISKVTIRIYNVLGQEVRTLVNQVQTAGQQVAIWDSRNSAGVTVSTGVYFYRIEASPISGKGNSFSDVKKMLLLK